MGDPCPAVRAPEYRETCLASTTESEGESVSNIEGRVAKISSQGVDLLAPLQVKATADLDILETDDEESLTNPSSLQCHKLLKQQPQGSSVKNILLDDPGGDRQKRAPGSYIDIKACLKTLCFGRECVQAFDNSRDSVPSRSQTFTHSRMAKDVAPQHSESTLSRTASVAGLGLGLAAACREGKRPGDADDVQPAANSDNEFELNPLSRDSVIPAPSLPAEPSLMTLEIAGKTIDSTSDSMPTRGIVVPAVVLTAIQTQNIPALETMPSLHNLTGYMQSSQTVDEVYLPPLLENAWYFRFTSTGEFKTPMDYALCRFTLRTCSYTYSSMCGVKSLLFNYYVAGDTSYDPVLVIPDFYQTPFCVAPLVNSLIKKKKCAYILDVSMIVARLQMHEIIVCYTEFILNVCLHFRTAGRRRSSIVGMGMQETARKISLIGQGSGANIALKLAIAITILSDGLDSLYTYDFARLVTARLMRDGMSNVNLTTMLSVRSVILCNPHLPGFSTVLKNKNSAMHKLIRQPKSVQSSRASLLHALGFETGMIADTKMPSDAFPNSFSSSTPTPATVKPNYLSYCPQELLDFYKKQISQYTKSTFLSASIMGKVSMPMEDIEGEPMLNVFEMYMGLTPLHRSSFPLNIFLGSDYNLFTGEDINLLSSLSEENTTVLLRTLPGCGADMLNTCKDILSRML